MEVLNPTQASKSLLCFNPYCLEKWVGRFENLMASYEANGFNPYCLEKWVGRIASGAIVRSFGMFQSLLSGKMGWKVTGTSSVTIAPVVSILIVWKNGLEGGCPGAGRD